MYPIQGKILKKISLSIHKRIEYMAKDLVVVRPDGLEDSPVDNLGLWTWKARILFHLHA